MPGLSLLIKPASGMCNMRCRYCFYTDVSAHRETVCYGTMSEETLQTLMRRAFSYAADESSKNNKEMNDEITHMWGCRFFRYPGKDFLCSVRLFREQYMEFTVI